MMIIDSICDRMKTFNYISVIFLIFLLLGACTGMKQTDIKIKDEKVAQLIKEAVTLYDKEKYDEALDLLSEAKNQARLPEDKLEIADVLSKGGFGLLKKKEFNTALAYYENSLDINRTLDFKPGLVNNYSYIGMIYTDLGRYEDGIEYFKKALGIQEELNDKSGIAQNLNNVANLYSYLGNYQESIKLLNQALGLSEEINDSTQTAKTLINLATINLRLRNYQNSIQYLNRALDIAGSAKEENLKAYSLNLTGAIYRQQGDYTKALHYYEDALTINKKLGLQTEIATNLSIIGELYKELGKYDDALKYFQQSLSISESSKDRLLTAINLNFIGEEKGDLVSAEKNYKEAVEVFESIREDIAGDEEDKQLFSDVNVRMYENLVSLLIRQGKKEEALEYVERSRSKTLRDTFLKSGITSFDEKTRGLLTLYDELSRKEASINYELVNEKGKPTPNSEKVDNLVKTLAKTRKDFTKVTSKLSTEHPDIYKLLSIQPGTFLDLEKKNKLPSNTVFVEYFITDKQTYIFLMSDKDLIVKRVSVTKEELNNEVSSFREIVQKNKSIPSNAWRDNRSDKYDDNIKPFKDVSIRLYRYLLDPIEDEIKDADIVAIIPFGSLHYLPFNALAKESSDGGLEFFIEKKGLVYLVSTSASYLDLVLRNGKKREIGSVVAFGNPDLGEPELVLPYSEEEVLVIKEVFPNATVFLKRDATKDNFKRSWGKYEIVHLAAHGLIQEDPSILLAPIGSGSLTLTDITGLQPARNTQLVVLSLCDE